MHLVKLSPIIRILMLHRQNLEYLNTAFCRIFIGKIMFHVYLRKISQSLNRESNDHKKSLENKAFFGFRKEDLHPLYRQVPIRFWISLPFWKLFLILFQLLQILPFWKHRGCNRDRNYRLVSF